jgi:stage II sporulation protein D
MSQYGALGMAKAGRTYDAILTYFYPGTRLGAAPVKQVRVLLAEGRSAVTIASTGPFSLRDAAGRVTRFPGGPITVRPDLVLPSIDTAPSRPIAASKAPLVFRPGKSPLSLEGREYRGKLELTVQNGFLRVVNLVDLESYLLGVVPAEMPFGWPPEALRAQAVAARSYALSHLLEGKPFDLYADVRSQVYAGIAAEKPSTTEAVRSTAGRVVLYEGAIASTLFHSSSGGRTASSADVFGVAIPYLVARPDPWDKTSPHHRWGPVLIGARTLQAKLATGVRVVDATAGFAPGGRLRSVVLQTTVGSQIVPASLVRSVLGLRSTWIAIGVVRLDRPPGGPVVFGSTVRLSGVARGLGAPTLSASSDGAAWTVLDGLVPDASGAVALDVKPASTARYRIDVESAQSPAQLMEVAPRLKLTVPQEPGTLAGTVRPKQLSGTAVTIERKTGAMWAPVGASAIETDGSFRVELTLVPGSYRARVGASARFAAATSPVLQVAG